MRVAWRAALWTLFVSACAVDPYLQSGLDSGNGPDASDDAAMVVESGGDSGGAMDSPPDTPPLPTCMAGVCVDATPNGWTGPLVLFDGTTPPACPSSYPTTAYNGNRAPNAPPATCGCTCGSVTGAQCGSPDVSIYTQTGCSNFCQNYNLSGCTSTSSCNTGNSIKVNPGNAFNGSCSKTPSKTVPSWTWGAAGRACGGATTSTMGCSGSAVCTPTPSGGFTAVCVMQAGDVPCPGGTFGIKHLYYGGATDTRDCTTCNCDQPMNVSCSNGTVTIYDASSCAGSTTTAAIDGQCHPLNGITPISVKVTTAATPMGGSCNKSNGAGQPTGQLTPTTPTTVCCNQ